MSAPVVGVIMGSRSDWETMRHACETLEALEVPFEQEADLRKTAKAVATALTKRARAK